MRSVSFTLTSFGLNSDEIRLFFASVAYRDTQRAKKVEFRRILISMRLGFSLRAKRIEIRGEQKKPRLTKFGGLKWTRTTDLTLIRRAL